MVTMKGHIRMMKPGPSSKGNYMGSVDPRIKVTPLLMPDADEAALLYTQVFLSDEPTSVRHAPDPAWFLPHARYYVRSLAGKGRSYIARDEETRAIVGFIFGMDLADHPSEEGHEMQEFLASFTDAIAMIDELEERVLDLSGLGHGTVLHIFQIGVAREYRRRGIAGRLVDCVLDRARDQGFRQVVADCTGRESAQVFAQCGFVEAGVYPYEEYCRGGVHFFSGIEGGISLMVKDLPDPVIPR